MDKATRDYIYMTIIFVLCAYSWSQGNVFLGVLLGLQSLFIMKMMTNI